MRSSLSGREILRARTIKPRSKEVMSALERATHLAEELRGLPEEERRALFFRNIERIRAQAIEKGMALDDEREDETRNLDGEWVMNE